MKAIVSRFLILFGAVALAGGAAPAATDLSTSQAMTFTDKTLGSMPYRLFRPEGYDSDKKNFPVILYLHGAGERGTDNLKQVTHHIDQLILETQKGAHKALLIAPQAPENTQWVDVPWGKGSYTQADLPPLSRQLKLAMEILDQTLTQEKADKSRVYVVGISMGGFGAWDAISRFPDRFAAAVPMSGGGNVEAAPLLKNKPIWVWHGARDAIVPVSGSDDMIRAIEAAGGHPLYTRPEEGIHGRWDGFFQPGAVHASGISNGPDVYDWLFAQALAVPEPTSLLPMSSGMLFLLQRPTRTRPRSQAVEADS